MDNNQNPAHDWAADQPADAAANASPEAPSRRRFSRPAMIGAAAVLTAVAGTGWALAASANSDTAGVGLNQPGDHTGVIPGGGYGPGGHTGVDPDGDNWTGSNRHGLPPQGGPGAHTGVDPDGDNWTGQNHHGLPPQGGYGQGIDPDGDNWTGQNHHGGPGAHSGVDPDGDNWTGSNQNGGTTLGDGTTNNDGSNA